MTILSNLLNLPKAGFTACLIVCSPVAVLAAEGMVAPAQDPHAGEEVLAEFPERPVDDNEIMATFSEKLGAHADAGELTNGQKIDGSLKKMDSSNALAKLKIALSSETAKSEKPAEIYRKHIDSVLMFGNVYKCGRCEHWHTGATASAWVLDKEEGIIVTNYHVLEGEGEESFFGVATRAGEVYAVAEVLAADKAADAAVIRVDVGDRPFPSELQLGAVPSVGEDVVVLSNPKRRFFTLTKGYVSRFFVSPQPEGETKQPKMTITADYAVGSSGGPVLNSKGEVIGMVCTTQTVLAGGHEEGKNDGGMVQMVFKDCVPVVSIRALLNSVEE